MAVATVKSLTRNQGTLFFNLTSAVSSEFMEEGAALHRENIQDGTTMIIATTGFETVTCPIKKDEKLAFIVTFASTLGTVAANPVLRVSAGSADGGWRRSLGNYNLTLFQSSAAQIAQYILGPFESARFAQLDTSTSHGKANSYYIKFGFAATADMTTHQAGRVNILPFSLPDVSYDT